MELKFILEAVLFSAQKPLSPAELRAVLAEAAEHAEAEPAKAFKKVKPDDLNAALEQLVRAGEPMSLSALAECRKCVRSNITQLVDRLEAEGLVELVDDPIDRRAVRARVTELGEERYAAGTQAIRGVQAELAAKVSKEDREHFLRVISAFRKNA